MTKKPETIKEEDLIERKDSIYYCQRTTNSHSQEF